jgi:hypothetical protein
MRPISSEQLWIGHVGDARDSRAVHAAGIAALVDLAGNEPPLSPPRDLVYCRFPLIDGAGNPPWMLQIAIRTASELLQRNTPTLIFCSAGMSRSVAIAAAALSSVHGTTLEMELERVVRGTCADLSPGLWRDVKDAMGADAIE